MEDSGNSKLFRRVCLSMVIAGIALLGLSWVFANPPGAAPDEFATYTKAMATAFGEFRPTPLPAPGPKVEGGARFDSISIGFFKLPTRYVADPRWGCTRFAKEQGASCLNASLPATHGTPTEVKISSYVAFYPPGVFALLGLGARIAPNANDALYAGRLISLIVCTILIGLAFVVTKGRWAIVGLLAAVSPMTIFMASTFNPNGVEIAAGIAFAASIVALARGHGANLAWVVFLVAGVLLAVARPTGFVWTIMDVGFLVALTGSRAVRHLFRSSLGRVAGAVVALATLSTAAWDVVVNHSPHVPWQHGWHEVSASIHQLSLPFDQFVGVFGWVDVPLSRWATQPALIAYAALLGVAMLSGGWRARVSLLLFALGVFVVAVVLDAETLIPFGFGVQARYLMPVAVMLLIAGGSVIEQRLSAGSWGRHRARPQKAARSYRWSLAVAVPFAIGFSLLQLYGWLSNSHTAAVGANGTWSFVAHAVWVPPGGWPMWVVLACCGTVILMVGATTLLFLGPQKGRLLSPAELD